MTEVAGLAYPEDSVAAGLVTVESVHHVLVQVVALQLHLHLCLSLSPPLSLTQGSGLYQHLEHGHCSEKCNGLI